MSQQPIDAGHLPKPSYRPSWLLAHRCVQVVRLVLLAWAWLGLVACSENQSRPENSELRADPPVAAETRAPAGAPVAEPPTDPLPGAGRRYQVAVGTAYFFDKPEQSAPNGRYLRRGDTFYGEGETNGFVRTGYVQPNGVTSTAWLKLQELRPLSSRQARPEPPSRATTPAPTTPDYATGEATRTKAPANATGARRAVVEVERAYFHDSPDLATPRKAFCQRGDKVQLVDTRAEAVYVTFTNWEKVTTRGWMRKSELRLLQ